MILRKTLWLAGLLSASIAANDVYACATCGCSLSTDAAMGYSDKSGWAMSLDYSFIDQNQYRHGTGTISAYNVWNSNQNV